MDIFNVYIKAFDLTPQRKQILSQGAKLLEGYFRDVINYGNYVLNHKIYSHARCIYDPPPNSGDIKDDTLLLYITPFSYVRCLIGKNDSGEAAGISKNLQSNGIISEILWPYIEKAGDPARALANYGFHELMHNKVFIPYPGEEENSKYVHSHCGLGVMAKLIAPEAAGKMIPNPANLRAMAALYPLPKKQYNLLLHRVPQRCLQKP
jgi:hypothetical protein